MRCLEPFCPLAAFWVAMALATTGLAQDQSLLCDALSVWQMKDERGSGRSPSRLVATGAVDLGVRLEGEDLAASLARGGDGYSARFRQGYLTCSSETPIQLTGRHATLCLRLRDPSGKWTSCLLASASPADPLANLVYGDGRNVIYRWRTTPPWQRVEGIQKPGQGQAADADRGTYGFNGESNDAHDLREYPARQWICSVVRVHDDGRVIVADQHGQAEGAIDIDCQQVSDEAFYVGSKTGGLEFLEGDIAGILVYNRPLADDETARLLQDFRAKGTAVLAADPAKSQIPPGQLVLHLDAAQAQADDGGRVSRWTDLSGNARDMQQSVADLMPRRVVADDGRPAIHFQNGQFLQGPAVLAEGDDSFTIAAVWRRDHLDGSQVVCEQNSSGKQRGRRAALLAQGSRSPAGQGMLRNRDFADGVLPVSAPVDWFGRDGWHDVVVRFADTVVELYVDGVLIDEQWPHGPLHRFCSPFLFAAGYGPGGRLETGFLGEIDHVALWDRALSPQEITALSGGPEHVARRDLEILGRPQKSLQYWKPRGKAYAGDCMVTCHDGVFHIFYLYDRFHHGAKWGLGAHQYGHFSSSDLKQWTEHPLAVPIDRQWECAMGTGNVIHNDKDGKWYAFYTDCGSRIQFFDKPQRGAWLFRSVSDDGIHFRKDFKPVLPGFDSDIFFAPETGLFHLIAEGGRTHYQSADLVEWTAVEESEFRKTAERDDLSRICPDTLAWNGWHYFTTGSSRIYKSRNPLGPWQEISQDIFDGLYYSKMHAFKDGRALAAGWVGFPEWGGNLVVRELVQSGDGNLGLKFVPEMVPATGDPLPLRVAERKGDARGDLPELVLRAGDSLAYAAVDEVPHDVRIRLTVRPLAGIEAFGLCVRGDGDYREGSELLFLPAKNHVQFGHPLKGGLDAIQPVRTTMSGDTGAMPPVAGLDQPLTIDLVAKDRILDVCIGNRRTFIARRSDRGGHRLFFVAKGGQVAFEQIDIRPLACE